MEILKNQGKIFISIKSLETLKTLYWTSNPRIPHMLKCNEKTSITKTKQKLCNKNLSTGLGLSFPEDKYRNIRI